MNSRIKRSVVPLVAGVVLGAVCAVAIMRSTEPPQETAAPEFPSIREVARFAGENIAKETKAGGGVVDEEMLKRQGLALMLFIWGEPRKGFTRTVRIVKTEEAEEVRIRVFDDNGLAGGGYDFDFEARRGLLKGLRFVPGQ